jgi:hypothetical protein
LHEASELELQTTPTFAQKSRASVEKVAGQQTRKIFVGGVPQSINQNDLYKMFSKFGKVKKAWLQMFPADRPEVAMNRHRGFGFVIFAQEAAVEDLLGEDFSKIAYFGDGIKLEVKRAIAKPGTFSNDSDIYEGEVKSQRFSEQNATNLPLETGFTPFPQVPPFPVMPAAPIQWQCCNVGAVAMLPSQPLFPSTTNTLDWLDHFLPSILRDAFAGQRLQNKQELEWVLLLSMPDRYEE